MNHDSLLGRGFDFYEFTGNILPGAVFLIGIAPLSREAEQFHFLVPESIGSVLVFVMIAYVVGHLFQGIGNLFERGYWRFWGGKPTDWPVTKPQNEFIGFAWVRQNLPSSNGYSKEDLIRWRTKVREAQTQIVNAGYSRRLDVFNGNYLLFRGLLVSEIGIAAFWLTATDPKLIQILRACIILMAILGLTLYRMHNFAMHYARELFSEAGLLEAKNKEFCKTGGRQNDA